MATGVGAYSDCFGRSFKYLRLSITNRCQFRCQYCLPNGFQPTSKIEELGLREILFLAKAFSELGVEKLRITGGEPTLRGDFLQITKALSESSLFKTMALSTNGYDLLKNCENYKATGIQKLNVSLDDLRPDEFLRIRGVSAFNRVYQGIEKALEIGFESIKINSVILREGFFERVNLFEEWIKNRPVTVRFIELMPTLNTQDFHSKHHMSSNGFHSYLIQKGWVPQSRGELSGPAVEYSHKSYVGRLGIIAPYSENFCQSCNRLRVSSAGELELCLFGKNRVPLRSFLKSADQKDELKRLICESLKMKEVSHFLNLGEVGSQKSLSSIGG